MKTRVRLILAVVLAAACSTACATQARVEISPDTTNAPIQYVSVSEQKIAYRTIGTGEPLVLVNRFRADMNHWDPVYIDQLATHRKVIMFDYPGIGASDGETKADIGEMANDLVGFLDALDLAQVDLVGWSLGTAVGLNVASNYPERVDQMVMLGAIFAGGMKQAYITPDIQEFIKRAGKPQPEIEDFVYILFGDTPHSKQAGVSSLKRRALWKTPSEGIPAIQPDQWQQHFKAINAYQTNSKTINGLQVKSPVLFIAGDRDHIAPPRIAAEWIQHIQGSQLAVFPSSGHNVHGQSPVPVATMTLEFLGNE